MVENNEVKYLEDVINNYIPIENSAQILTQNNDASFLNIDVSNIKIGNDTNNIKIFNNTIESSNNNLFIDPFPLDSYQVSNLESSGGLVRIKGSLDVCGTQLTINSQKINVSGELITLLNEHSGSLDISAGIEISGITYFKYDNQYWITDSSFRIDRTLNFNKLTIQNSEKISSSQLQSLKLLSIDPIDSTNYLIDISYNGTILNYTLSADYSSILRQNNNPEFNDISFSKLKTSSGDKRIFVVDSNGVFTDTNYLKIDNFTGFSVNTDRYSTFNQLDISEINTCISFNILPNSHFDISASTISFEASLSISNDLIVNNIDFSGFGFYTSNQSTSSTGEVILSDSYAKSSNIFNNRDISFENLDISNIITFPNIDICDNIQAIRFGDITRNQYNAENNGYNNTNSIGWYIFNNLPTNEDNYLNLTTFNDTSMQIYHDISNEANTSINLSVGDYKLFDIIFKLNAFEMSTGGAIYNIIGLLSQRHPDNDYTGFLDDTGNNFKGISLVARNTSGGPNGDEYVNRDPNQFRLEVYIVRTFSQNASTVYDFSGNTNEFHSIDGAYTFDLNTFYRISFVIYNNNGDNLNNAFKIYNLSSGNIVEGRLTRRYKPNDTDISNNPFIELTNLYKIFSLNDKEGASSHNYQVSIHSLTIREDNCYNNVYISDNSLILSAIANNDDGYPNFSFTSGIYNLSNVRGITISNSNDGNIKVFYNGNNSQLTLENTQLTFRNIPAIYPLYIDNSGFLKYNETIFSNITSGTFNNLSDDRLKFNETVIRNGLEIIRKLNPQLYDKTFTFKSPDFTGLLSEYYIKEAGLIAQDIQNINDISYIVESGDESNPYKVKYNDIFIYYLAGIKELSEIIDKQKLIINDLSNKLYILND